MRQLKEFEELIGFDRREGKPNGRRAPNLKLPLYS